MSLIKRVVVMFMTLALVFVSIGPAHAAFLNSDQVAQMQAATEAKASLLMTIARTDVQQRLIALGVDPAQVEQRISQLTPDELQRLNQRMAELPAGAGVLELVVFIFLIFIITDMLGATDVFPFVRPIR